MADIDVGQLSEAINDKMDRDAHNVESPSAVVIESQMPTADNGYTWYRKYSDGWVEQGGTSEHTTNEDYAITLPIAMKDNNYTIVVTISPKSSPATDVAYNDRVSAFNITDTSFKLRGSNVTTVSRHSWQVSGKYAI